MRLVVALRRIHRAEQSTGIRLHDVDRPASVRPEVHHGRSALGVGPEPARGPAPEEPLLAQGPEQVLRRRPEETEIRLRQRQFGRRGAQVRAEHVRIGGVEHGGLDGEVEHCLRMVHEIGVEGIVAGDECGDGVLARPPGPADLLHERGTGARPAGHEDGVEAGDVDPEFQG